MTASIRTTRDTQIELARLADAWEAAEALGSAPMMAAISLAESLLFLELVRAQVVINGTVMVVCRHPTDPTQVLEAEGTGMHTAAQSLYQQWAAARPPPDPAQGWNGFT